MKRISLIVVMIVSALCVVGQGQTAGESEFIAKIRFTFQIGEKVLPAGTYRVSIVNRDSGTRILQIRNESGRTQAMVQTSNLAGKPQATARLVFHRYTDTYYFAEAWFASDGNGLGSRKSAREKRDQRLARTKMKTEILTADEGK